MDDLEESAEKNNDNEEEVQDDVGNIEEIPEFNGPEENLAEEDFNHPEILKFFTGFFYIFGNIFKKDIEEINKNI